MDKKEVTVKKEFIDKLGVYMAELEYLCDNNVDLYNKIQEVKQYLDENLGTTKSEREILEDFIYDKMMDSKKSDRDLYAKLYMLYQDVKNGRIDLVRARELCDSFVRFSNYEKRIY